MSDKLFFNNANVSPLLVASSGQNNTNSVKNSIFITTENEKNAISLRCGV